jgi:Zn-dependent peptidase ImmA (M78 family)
MKFKMNDREWEIIELSQEEIREKIREYKYDGEPKEGRYFGLTYLDNSKIYIDKDLCLDQKKQTLKHELMHCYIGCYLFNVEKEYTEEDLCNISSNSHDIIHKIVEDYFKKDKQNAN